MSIGTVSRCQQFAAIHMFLGIMALALIFPASVSAASRDDIDFATGESLPPDVWQILIKDNAYSIVAWINPFYLQADFDGDGTRDTAVLVQQRATAIRGAAIVLGNGKLRIIGAGEDIGNGTTDLGWMDAWYVEPRSSIPKGLEARGDGLMVIKTESASGLIWWNGKRFQWLQQGD